MLHVAFGLAPDAADFDALKEEFLANYELRLTRQTFVFEGVAELIERIVSSGLKWGVVTNKAARFTLPLTRGIPLFSSALTIISGDTTPHSKPHPAPLLEAARQMGLAAERCVYVGDDERDMIAGRAAGMSTVAATYGYLGNAADLDSWKADFAISRPCELLSFLKMA